MADLHRNDLVACAMCIISNCEADFNLLGEWKCRGDEFPVCPECQSPIVWECHTVWSAPRPRRCVRPSPELFFKRTRRISPPPCLSVQSLYSPSICKFPVNHFHVKSCKFILQSVQSSNFDTIPEFPSKPCFSAVLFHSPISLIFLRRIIQY